MTYQVQMLSVTIILLIILIIVMAYILGKYQENIKKVETLYLEESSRRIELRKLYQDELKSRPSIKNNRPKIIQAMQFLIVLSSNFSAELEDIILDQRKL